MRICIVAVLTFATTARALIADAVCPVNLDEDGLPLTLQHHDFGSATAEATRKDLGLGRAVSAGDETLEAVLKNVSRFSAILVVVPGFIPPLRRDVTVEPFLAVVGSDNSSSTLAQALALPALNSASAVLESFLGRMLFPLRLNMIDLGLPPHQTRPLAVYDVSNGDVYLDDRVLQNLRQIPQASVAAIGEFGSALFRSFVDVLQGKGQAQDWGALFGTAGPAAIYAAMATGSVPLWLCISCVIVLGMGFPFLFNFGLGAVAEQVCTHYNLPAEECNDLWYGAFALAMILSFASAIPIVYICRLPDCIRQHFCLSTQ